ncbi:MAG: BlaI/MecI/CopY family transcriptional regulator [Bacteroidales bacterium]|nr:BlaI/MecI/CopY family transcriptional regulator [Bacteroidales bacterium]
MKELTKAEEQVMQYLWEIKKGFLKDIVDKFPEPKPAYTTISTVVRVLVNKGFINFKTYGKSNEYHPKVGKTEYTKVFFKGITKNFFNNSASKLVSFFTSENDLSLTELELLKKQVEEQIELKKKTEK